MPSLTTEPPRATSRVRPAFTLYVRALDILARGAVLVAPPVLRIALALPFLRSGMTRWDGFLSVTPSTTYLFDKLFKLNILGGTYPIPFPAVTGTIVAVAEIVLPIMLLAGLGTRAAALGLLAMTGVIQLVMPDGWANFHLYWAALALAIMALGAGPVSLDWLVARLGDSRARAKRETR